MARDQKKRKGDRAQQRPVVACKNERAAHEAGRICAQSARCGACSCVNVAYAEQLARKDAAMRALFESVVPADALETVLRPILGMDDPFHFRNKVVSPFAPGRKGEILTGMYAAGTHRLVDTAGCAVENEQANAVIQAVRSIMKRHDMQPYNEDTGAGFVRHVMVRAAHKTGEMLVTVVTNGEEFPASRGFCRELVRRCPSVTTVVQNINMRDTNVILGERERTLYGPGFILDELCGLSFRISSRSFYQVNAVQTEVLYETAVQAAALTGCETVIDAYCGTGTIGLVAAAGLGSRDGQGSARAMQHGGQPRGAARVIGVDSVESAIRDARLNARHNGIETADFVCADATEYMYSLASGRAMSHVAGGSGNGSGSDSDMSACGERAVRSEAPLVLMMDPPRAGSTEEFLDAAAALAPVRIVYISCNPTTQVRDMRHLMKKGYAVRSVQPVDMFPHTDHVETVVLLERSVR